MLPLSETREGRVRERVRLQRARPLAGASSRAVGQGGSAFLERVHPACQEVDHNVLIRVGAKDISVNGIAVPEPYEVALLALLQLAAHVRDEARPAYAVHTEFLT